MLASLTVSLATGSRRRGLQGTQRASALPGLVEIPAGILACTLSPWPLGKNNTARRSRGLISLPPQFNMRRSAFSFFLLPAA